jgi:hypothetical protein
MQEESNNNARNTKQTWEIGLKGIGLWRKVKQQHEKN